MLSHSWSYVGRFKWANGHGRDVGLCLVIQSSQFRTARTFQTRCLTLGRTYCNKFCSATTRRWRAPDSDSPSPHTTRIEGDRVVRWWLTFDRHDRAHGPVCARPPSPTMRQRVGRMRCVCARRRTASCLAADFFFLVDALCPRTGHTAPFSTRLGRS